MSKLLENKNQLIHIATEVAVLISLTVYFNYKNRKLSKLIEELTLRVEEQEKVILKHDQDIKKIIDFINNSQQQPPRSNSAELRSIKKYKQPVHTSSLNKPNSTPQRSEELSSIKKYKQPVHTSSLNKPVSAPQRSEELLSTESRVKFNTVQFDSSSEEENEEDNEEEENESDLDAEIAIELQELNTDDYNLKT